MKECSHITKEEHYQLIGEYEASFYAWHKDLFPDKREIDKVIIELTIWSIEEKDNE